MGIGREVVQGSYPNGDKFVRSKYYDVIQSV